MSKYPRTTHQFLPYLERIHAVWQNFRPPADRWQPQISADTKIVLTVALFAMTFLLAPFAFTDRLVSQAATWEVIDERSAEISLSFDGRNSSPESIVSEPLLRHLRKNQSRWVTVTFKVPHVFGIPWHRGPILEVDGFHLEN